MARARRGPLANFPPALVRLVDELAAEGHSALEIFQALREEYPGTSTFQAPSKRTIERYLRDATGAEADVWRWFESSGDEARHGLDVLGAVIGKSGGRRRYLTRAEAAVAIKLRQVAPELDPWAAYVLARRYVVKGARGESTEELDSELALAPWRSAENAQRFEQLREHEVRQALLFKGVDAAVELANRQGQVDS